MIKYNNKSQEIWYNVFVVHTFLALLVCLERHERVIAWFVHLHETRQVIAPVTVVRSRPHRHQILLRKPLIVSFLCELMGPCYQLQSVMVVKLGDDFVAEKPSSPSVSLGPGLDFFRVRPHEVGEGSFGGYFHNSVDFPDLIESVDVWGEASVHTEDLIW